MPKWKLAFNSPMGGIIFIEFHGTQVEADYTAEHIAKKLDLFFIYKESVE